MSLKFAANVSTLFKDAGPLNVRFAAAKSAGFTAVELQDPYDIPVDELRKVREATGLEVVLMNTYKGDREDDCGLAAKPSRLQDFKDSLEKTIEYAKALQCKRVHVLAGRRPAAWEDTAMVEVYRDNMKFAADRLQEEGITALIEPINSFLTVQNYFMDSPDKAMAVIKKLNHPNLKLQLDIFHLQLTAGNLTHNIKDLLPYTDHVQIAQAPDRREPESPGEINYDYVFSVLKGLKYDGWIGLEFNPTVDTITSLQWTLKYSK